MGGQAVSVAAADRPGLADELQTLVPVALRGLSQMQDDRTGLFSHKAWVGPDGRVENRGVNPLYTGACIIGLLSCEAAGVAGCTGQATRALDALLQRSHTDVAVLATALWGCVLAGRSEGGRLADALIGNADPARLSSMQLGLALTGLAQWLRAGDAQPARVAGAAWRLADELTRRYVARAQVFAATGARTRRTPGMSRLTSFASQVYPVLGLCHLAEATGVSPPLAVIRICQFLARSQGPLGQWWWLYSTDTPQVIEGYPVYSVHQDAMAVMALLPASRLGGGDYLAPLSAGLRWVAGDNELGRPMIDRRAGLIHRALQRPGGDADGLAGCSRRQRAAAYLASLAGAPRPVPQCLEPVLECRSYHLGWLLLAAAAARHADPAPAGEPSGHPRRP